MLQKNMIVNESNNIIGAGSEKTNRLYYRLLDRLALRTCALRGNAFLTDFLVFIRNTHPGKARRLFADGFSGRRCYGRRDVSTSLDFSISRDGLTAVPESLIIKTCIYGNN
jgi:hypothetical protein